MSSIFLKAEWRKLAMANYIVDPKVFEPYLPYKTELDLWNGNCYVSLVGFMFKNTRVLGLKFPFHVNFEEVNLRFYVKYKHHNEWRRGVVFIKEIVPRMAITLVANTLYKEKYETMPMRHTWLQHDNIWEVNYQWKKFDWHSFGVRAQRTSIAMLQGSEEEFITEHFWGYTQISDSKTNEYEVAHPRWEVYPVIDYNIQVDFGKVYGTAFSFLNQMQPASVFLAEGSEILVKRGLNIT